jgi:hypothetical protein
MLQSHIRTVRRHSPWLRKHRRSISVGLAVLIVGTSAIAVTVSGATPPATWNLPFPRTMSYKVLSTDPNIKCTQPDAVFEQEVVAEGLDKYAIDMVTGHRGECGRLKAEQFKRLFPSKMVMLYESPSADDPRTWPGGTWAGYYLMMNRTTATAAVTSSQTSISVADPGAFMVGDTAVMWSPTPGDAFANSEWVSVKSIVGSTLTVTRDLFSTGAHAYASAPLLAAAATGPGYPYPAFNLSDVAPVNPANGERANQWMAQNIINDFAPSGPGSPTLDAVEFDAASWAPEVHNTNGTAENLDCNADGIIDYCNQNVGTAQQVNAFGVGYDSLVQAVKQGLTVYDTDATRPPKMVLADGSGGLRSLGAANGAEFESYPSWDNYTYSSAALATLDVWQNQDTAPGDHLSYAFTKDITPTYPQSSSINPTGCVTPAQGGTCRNGEYRYGMASALMWGAANSYNNEASFNYPQPWDEEATIDQSTTGLTPGYLGHPLGNPVRTTRYSTGNLVTNPSFETDLTTIIPSTVVPAGLTVTQDPTTAAPGWGTASLRAKVTGLTADPQIADSRLFAGLNTTITPGEYTIDFWAKATNNAAGPQAVTLGVGLDGVTGAPQVILLTNTWTHYYVQVDATTSQTKNAAVKFSFGTQIGSYWLDGVKVRRGTAGIMTREFTNGIVVLNDSFTSQTNIALPGGPYHHINGVQNPTVNDGTEVGSALPAIAAKDGEILLRG